MGFFSSFGSFVQKAAGIAQGLAPIVTAVNPAIGMGMSSIGGIFAKAPQLSSGGGGGGGIFTPAAMGSSLPNLGIYSPPGGLPKPTTSTTTGPGGGTSPVYQEAGMASAAGALIKALSPAARALARRGVPWLRANWRWLASVVGSTILAELGQWMLASETHRRRRMNVLNPRALRRALRRTHGFASYAKRSITLERHGYKGVKFKKRRRAAA